MLNNKCKYFTRDEVIIHNKIDDIWIIINNRVFDLTEYFYYKKSILTEVISNKTRIKNLILLLNKFINYNFFNFN